MAQARGQGSGGAGLGYLPSAATSRLRQPAAASATSLPVLSAVSSESKSTQANIKY